MFSKFLLFCTSKISLFYSIFLIQEIDIPDYWRSYFIWRRIIMVLIIVYQSSLMKQLESSPKIAEIESRLTKYTFLSRNNLPGYLDGIIFQALKKNQKYPDRTKNPNFYHWYILLRQFAASAINKWVQDRLYYDSNDAHIQFFLKQQTSQTQQTVHAITSNNSPRQEASTDSRNPRGETGGQAQYEIDILLKELTSSMIDSLKRDLQCYRLDIFVSIETKQVKIKCGSQSSKCQQIANLISKTLEYSNLQVKKDKKIKQSIREQPLRE